jgi:hypothetical protein
MPNYRRSNVPGGTYFFTVVPHERRTTFADLEARRILGDVIREYQRDWPFTINTIVLLPDHLHAIWTLPPSGACEGSDWMSNALHCDPRCDPPVVGQRVCVRRRQTVRDVYRGHHCPRSPLGFACRKLLTNGSRSSASRVRNTSSQSFIHHR